MSSELRICEFYSGIGGYHIALSLLENIPYRVVGAFEISSNANLIYRHNFPATPVFETNLCGLTAAKLDALTRDNVVTSRDNVVTSRDNVVESRDQDNSTMFVMSPPCQPFTRQGTKKDELDPRSQSVLHLFDMFSGLESLPGYFLLENVKGFEVSNTRKQIMTFFTRHGYHIREYLLNSNQFGIPNSRLRYYLLARRKPFLEEMPSDMIHTALPVCDVSPSAPLSRYLERNSAGFEISDRFLSKWGRLLDIVTSHSTRSCCFTKGYSVKAEGSGSVLQQSVCSDSQNKVDIEDNQQSNSLRTHDSTSDNSRSLTNIELSGEEFVAHMKSLKLRYFTPREIARIHGIPESYDFPGILTNKQLYKLLGNGLNVTVVRLLLENVLLKS